jgi:hypothetical protein
MREYYLVRTSDNHEAEFTNDYSAIEFAKQKRIDYIIRVTQDEISFGDIRTNEEIIFYTN